MADTFRPASLYVAPDPETGDPGFVGHFNTLVIRPEYKLEIKFFKEDMHLLFPDDPTTKKGKMTRLQALSYFALRVAHANADAALDVAWPWFKKNEVPSTDQGDEAKCIAKLADMLGTKIVEGGAFPRPAEKRKIYLHGGYAMADEGVFNDYFLKEVKNPKTKLEKAGGTQAVNVTNRWEFETVNLKDNDALGKVPIVVQVKQRFPGGVWEPAVGVTVYFQLIKPDVEQTDVQPSANRKSFIDAKATADKGTDAEDPQQENLSKALGGKRGHPVAGKEPLMNLFETDVARAGFHTPPAGWGGDLWKKSRHDPNITDPKKQKDRKPYQVATPSNDSDIPNAAMNATNEDGETGVIFMPSRVGGDRYRFRVFVGPPSIISNGKENTATPPPAPLFEHIAETGTFEIWRTARISQVLGRSGSIEQISFASITTEFKKAFMHVYYDSTAQVTMSQTDWLAAYTAARNFVTGQTYNFLWPDILLPTAPGAGGDWVAMTPSGTYNTQAAAAHPTDQRLIQQSTPTSPLGANQKNELDRLVRDMIQQMMKHVTKGGYVPGVTIIRAERQEPDEYVWCIGSIIWGLSSNFNGAYTFYEANSGVFKYSDYKNSMLVQSTNLHEVSHSWLLRHQYTDSGEGEGTASPLIKLHEQYFTNPGTKAGATADNICLMSYHKDNFGENCGKCVLSLRGWDAISIT